MMSKKPQLSPKLEKTELWPAAIKIAQMSYRNLEQLPEEEKWGMQYKLRLRAYELTNHLAEAYGAIDPREKVHSFGQARQSLFSLKNVTLMTHKVGLAELDPQFILDIDKLVEKIDAAINAAGDKIPEWYTYFQDGTMKEEVKAK